MYLYETVLKITNQVILHAFCHLQIFSKPTFLKNSLLWPDLGPFCLQKLSTENTSRQGVNCTYRPSVCQKGN